MSHSNAGTRSVLPANVERLVRKLGLQIGDPPADREGLRRFRRDVRRATKVAAAARHAERNDRPWIFPAGSSNRNAYLFS